MSDSIRYRLPGTKTVVSSQGTFALLNDSNPPTGFVVTDFLHQRVYQFNEQPEAIEEWHEAAHAPVVISPRDYQIEAQAMLHAFPALGVRKAVYSRVKAVSFPLEKAEALFNELEQTYPKAFVYLITSELFGTWIGATPEVLTDVEGETLKTVALAGTHPAGETTEWARKDLEEHQFVVDAVMETLQRNDCFLLERSGPTAVPAGPVQHLKTNFTAATGTVDPWKIAMDLHPTPAVCGTPRMAALDLIVSREMHERELYAGVIGMYATGTAKLFVNLRCAQLQRGKAYLYVGGGYTIDSLPELEWEETENKARTLLNCMEKL